MCRLQRRWWSLGGRTDRADRLRRSVCVTLRPEGLEKCFTCIRKALSLPSDDQNIDTLF